MLASTDHEHADGPSKGVPLFQNKRDSADPSRRLTHTSTLLLCGCDCASKRVPMLASLSRAIDRTSEFCIAPLSSGSIGWSATRLPMISGAERCTQSANCAIASTVVNCGSPASNWSGSCQPAPSVIYVNRIVSTRQPFASHHDNSCVTTQIFVGIIRIVRYSQPIGGYGILLWVLDKLVVDVWHTDRTTYSKSTPLISSAANVTRVQWYENDAIVSEIRRAIYISVFQKYSLILII